MALTPYPIAIVEPLRPISERGLLFVLILVLLLNGGLAIRYPNHSQRVTEISTAILIALSSLKKGKDDDSQGH